MNILLTNDDGYHADGINYLKKYFEDKGENVFIVAPDKEKSGAGHSITLHDAIRLIKHTENVWALRATPADCVVMALLGLVPEKIDVVISGINHGPNIGRDILYSGTAACARQGGFSGIPSIALSMNAWRGPYHFEVVGDFLDKNFGKIISSYNNCDFFYNINIPNVPLSEIKGIQITKPCKKHYYQDSLIHFDSPSQGRYYWVDGAMPVYELEEGTDAKAVKSGFISVSPIKVFPEKADVNIKL
jgi:5'-nucleotidase